LIVAGESNLGLGNVVRKLPQEKVRRGQKKISQELWRGETVRWTEKTGGPITDDKVGFSRGGESLGKGGCLGRGETEVVHRESQFYNSSL